MLETIIVALVVIWIIALIAKKTLGGLIHLILVVAIIVFIVRFIQS